MGILTRDGILKHKDIATEQVEVPEWGGYVLVRGLTGRERDAFEEKMLERKRGKRSREVNLDNMRAKLTVLSVVDEAGALLFSEGDLDALGNKSAAALSRVFDVAQRLSGLRDEDLEELGEGSSGDPDAG